jgi:DnaB helicase-like protein
MAPLPPHDPKAEQALIGATLLDATVPNRVRIDAADFYKPNHETLWAVIASLNDAPDRPLALVQYLQRTGQLPRIGGAPYVHSNGSPWDSGNAHAGQRDLPGQNWADHLFAAVGPGRAEKIFAALTRILHPDVDGGSTELMQQLNVARDRARGGRR